MGVKLLWTGATVLLTSSIVNHTPATDAVGAVLMVIGCILLWLDK